MAFFVDLFVAFSFGLAVVNSDGLFVVDLTGL